MISVEVKGFRFQLRAAAVFLQTHSVLLHRLENDRYWSLPGGRVEPGEDARSTLVREVLEELAEPIECGEPLYLIENFFSDAGKPNHEIGLYFAATFRAESALWDTSRSHWGIEGACRLEFRWFPLAALTDIDLQPSLLRESLAKPVPHLQHFVQRG